MLLLSPSAIFKFSLFLFAFERLRLCLCVCVDLVRHSLLRGSPQVEAESVPEVSEKMDIAMVPTFVLLKVRLQRSTFYCVVVGHSPASECVVCSGARAGDIL